MTDQERVAFVQDIELMDATRSVDSLGDSRDVAPIPNTGDAGAVVAGSILSFTANVRGETRQNVLDSTLLAQLAANAEMNATEDPAGWYKRYTNVLENVGWIIQGRSFSKHKSTSGALEIDKEAIGLLEAILSPNKLQVLSKTLDALRESSEDSKALTIFSGNTASGESGVFQLGAVEQDDNGDVSLAFGTFHFKTNTHKGRFLFVTWQDDQIGIEFATEQATLNENFYAVVKPHVQEKLAERQAQFVETLNI